MSSVLPISWDRPTDSAGGVVAPFSDPSAPWQDPFVEQGGRRAHSSGSVDRSCARVSDPTAIVWRGDHALPSSEQGVRILGTPMGHPVTRTAHVEDLQCAWLLL